MAKAGDKPLTKTQIIANVAERTELSKKEVAAVMEAISEEIKKSLGRSGPGAFTIPGLVKIIRKKVPAKPAQKGVLRFGKLMDVPAKKGYTTVKVRPLKNLKEMV
ncbi:MAG: HU family DNA-binding protein [Pirellulales bacterium]|nr:HU family DNA-binding protein [Pirellulales bacterium]